MLDYCRICGAEWKIHHNQSCISRSKYKREVTQTLVNSSLNLMSHISLESFDSCDSIHAKYLKMKCVDVFFPKRPVDPLQVNTSSKTRYFTRILWQNGDKLWSRILLSLKKTVHNSLKNAIFVSIVLLNGRLIEILFHNRPETMSGFEASCHSSQTV